MDKRTHLETANRLLATQDDSVLPYVALELRMTIEAIAYEKLRLYAPRIPAAVLDVWQPPQAVKALLEFEPRAGQNFRLRIRREASSEEAAGDWIDLGEHRTLPLKMLRESYNKLGSLLHLPSPRSQNRINNRGPQHAAKVREDLEAIARELAPVVESRIDSSLAAVTYFDCQVCGKLVVRNSESLRETHRAVCPSCAAEHWCEATDGDEWSIRLIATEFSCVDCNAPIAVENRRLDIGHTFECPTCKHPHIVVSREWGYTTNVPGHPAAPAA